jgi:hypothetical protein
MTATEIVINRARDISAENAERGYSMRISASPGYLARLCEEATVSGGTVFRNADTFTFDDFVVLMDKNLPPDCFLIKIQ